MSTYKCISCGATKESDSDCCCSVCGYNMFPTPYNRAELLKKEIRNFIAQLKYTDVQHNLFEIFRMVSHGKNKETGEEKLKKVYKTEDDKRFPSFRKIQEYVCSSQKTEEFYERVKTSIEEIRKHISTSYKREYQVSFDELADVIQQRDETLELAFEAMGIKLTLPKAELPEVSLNYSEEPDEKLHLVAVEILDYLEKFNDKIYQFIRQNNLYGTIYQNKPKSAYKADEEKDYINDLQNALSKLCKALDKIYIVDIFSDGSDELYEMLKVLWLTIETIMTIPVLSENCEYNSENRVLAINDDVDQLLGKKLCDKYKCIDEMLGSAEFLSDKSEEDLFGIYEKMIDLDTFGFMGVSKGDLFKIGKSEKKLESLIGLSAIKESVKKIKAYTLSNRESDDLNIHMCFLGNPGTGKTEVARCIADILYENKILPTNKVVEVDRSGLVSQYFGATAEKTKSVIETAMGGVLFVDEAYALGNNSDFGITDYGKEAIDTLVKAMEDYRGKFCVIFAGYKNEMLQMLKINPGMQSRIQFVLDFPNYSRDELRSIMNLMLENRRYSLDENAATKILDVTDVKRKEPNFANAREIRNILDQIIMCQNIRCIGTEDRELGFVDVNKYIQDAKINLPTNNNDNEKKVLSAEEELEQLVGLGNVKRMVKKIKAYAKKNKDQSDFNLHMCFCGNPGTGKTEVARILSRVFYEAGVLNEAKLVETDGQGLIGRYVGETAPKTEAKINEAMNGLLFIDEAYSLVSSGSNGDNAGYGDEAIAVLLKEMEDRRGQFSVVLAGYKNEMENLMHSNPGFKSRIQFILDFPDYNRDELEQIATMFVAKKKYVIEASALNLLLDVVEYYRNRDDFANARTVRNVVDQVIMNQNLRTEDDEDDDRTIVLSDVSDYLLDENIDLSKISDGVRKIGF